jgi:ribonuclease P protein component
LNTFKKNERLKSKKLIEQLFDKGKSVDAVPLKLIWMAVDGEMPSPVQAGFTVPKRNFPKAIDRNRIKRLMREAWRLQKKELYKLLDEKNLKLAAMLIFTGRKKLEYKEVCEKTATVIQRLEKSL